jgi:hypothetical protein
LRARRVHSAAGSEEDEDDGEGAGAALSAADELRVTIAANDAGIGDTGGDGTPGSANGTLAASEAAASGEEEGIAEVEADADGGRGGSGTSWLSASDKGTSRDNASAIQFSVVPWT